MRKVFRFMSVFLIFTILLQLFPYGFFTVNALTYEGSAQYMSSKYYTALCNVLLTGDQRTDIINVARSQVGYREGNCLDDLNGYNTGYHSYNNYCEYNYWYWGHNGAGGSGYPWCATFVTWCARRAGVSSDILHGSACAGCGPEYFNITYYNGSQYTPKPGDLFFTWSWSHVGLVTGVDGNSFTTIEGNTNNNGSSEGNGVYERTRSGLSNFHFGVPNYITCAHSYSNGHCIKCGELQPLQNDDAPCTIGIYEANTNVYLRTDPYETGANGINNCQLTLNKGTQVTVEGAVINGIGNKWYKVIFGNNIGYIYAPKLTYKSALQATISCSSLSVPTNHRAGSGYHISGTVTTKYCNIKRARAYFVNSATGQTLSNLVTSWYTINSNTLSLNCSSVDNALYFGRLSAGSYYYCIEVETDKSANGKTNHVYSSPVFTVGAVIIQPPEITEASSAVGNKTYSLSGTGTVYYRINDGSWIAGSSVTLYESCYLEAKCVSGNYSSGITSAYVSVPQVDNPVITTKMNANGATVTISAEAGATVYYRIGSGAAQQYTGTFNVSNACVVSAYAEKAGCITSYTATANITVSAPKKPVVVSDTSAHIAEGTAMSVHWEQDSLAASYAVTVKKDGVQWKTDTVTSSQYSFATKGAGKYDVSVVATNVIGSSEVSNTVSCTAHDPSTVVFQDWDGTVLSTQTVSYGSAATKPMAPSRRGYTFSGWSAGFSNVTSDMTIVAEYEINTYTVSFYDVDGAKRIATQEITFDESIDSAAVEPLVSIENGGRVFSGWYIMDADDASERDLAHVDSNMKLRAVTVWGNEDLPVFIDNISARLCYDSNNGMFNGYTVSCRVSTADARDINAKIIVTLLAVTDSESGTCKMINTKIDTINLTTSSSNMTWSGDILCDGTSGADYVEISVVSVEGNDRTGGLIAETKRYEITSEAARFWSEWMTKEELESHGHSISESTVESKTQYSDRTNTMNTITSSSATPPDGYTLLRDNSYWTDWSGWSTEPVAETATRQVRTEQRTVSQGYTEYRYGSWYNGSSSHFCGACISGAWKRYTDWSTTRYSPDKYDTWGYCSNYSHYLNGYHIGYTSYNGSTFYWNRWTIGGKNYYWEESQWIDTSYSYTVYSYRDYVGSYTYYKWDYGNWTDWTDEVLTDNNLSDLSYEVRTRQLYRYVVFDASQVEHNTIGTTQTISGQLEDANTNLEGRLASIFVYKSLNSDPTESQLEYIGQTTLGQNGTYNFTFMTKEEASVETGDFVIALAVEGSNGLINVGLVKYERPTYTVTFATESGTISTQQVEEGGSAAVPEAPEIEGFTFTGWNKSATNVTRNMTVVALYKPKDCCVVFVDYLNQVCELRHFDYGTVLSIPESMEHPSHKGYTFTDWSFGNDATVTGDMIVSANWEIESYFVTFYDETGTNIVSQQLVPYGSFATPPDNLDVGSDKVFLAWSDENAWWNVKCDTFVYPIVVYKETTAAPASNLFEITEGLCEELTLTSEEGATILYTLDGSEPNETHLNTASSDGTTFVYTAPLTLTEDTFIRAKAIHEGKNDSEIVEVLFIHSEELSNYNDNGEAIDLKKQNVTVSEFDTVSIQVDLSSNPGLTGYSFYIKADPSAFYVDFDRNTLDATAHSGTLCAAGGSLLVDDYEERLGWHVLWIGDASTLTNGSLLTLTLVAGAEISESTYPITVGYTTANTFGADHDPVSIASLANVTITAAPHAHSFKTTTTPPTCTSDGKEVHTCEVCGYSYEEPIAALGHDYHYIVTAEPSITSVGTLAGNCSRCSTTSVVTLPKLGTADYTYQVTQAPTCTSTGTGRYTWKVTTYGVFAFDVELPTGAHNYVNGVCTICGAIDPEYADAKLVVSGTTSYAAPGETVQIPVSISGEGSFAGFTLTIISSDGLTLTNIERGELLRNAEGSFTKNVQAGNVNWTSVENIDGNGELLVLTFAVSEDAEDDSQLTVNIQRKDNKPSNFVDELGAPVGVRFESITVAIRSLLLGDIDSDGDITSVDAVRLVRYLVDLVELTDRQKLAADVDHDNDITSTDAIKLVRYLVGLVDTLDAQPTRGISSRLNAAVVTVKDVNGRKGELVSVPAVIAGNPGFAGFTFEVNCPKTLELISVSSGTLLKSFDGGTFTFNKNKRIINWTSANNISEDGELFYLTFRVLEDTKKAYPVTLSVKDGKESNFANEESKQIIVNSFRDMPEKGQWAFDAINWAVGRKITSGTTATTFSPNAGCTRAQAVTFLWRMAGMPEPKSDECRFIDVAQDAYYYKAVLWAIEAGITEGTTKNTFGPDSTCTRAQIVTFLWRYQGSPVKRSATNTFEDVQAGAYYEKAVQWATESGITTGTSATSFSPNAVCTRAQIVTFLCRSTVD